MILKPNVNIENLVPVIKEKLDSLDDLYKSMREELVLSSGNDGKHKKGSKHYTDEAIDIRIKNIPEITIQRYILFLKSIEKIFQDVPFDVLISTNPPHIHIEFDPKPDKTKIKLRLSEQKETIKLYNSIPLPELDLDLDLLHKILNSDEFKKGIKIFKISANIVGSHYAGVKIFEESKEETILNKFLKTLTAFINKLLKRS